MSWPLKILSKLQLCLFGLVLQNASVMGTLVATKCPHINHLEQGRPLPKCKGNCIEDVHSKTMCPPWYRKLHATRMM